MSESLSAFAKRTGTATHDGCLLAADVLLNHPSAKAAANQALRVEFDVDLAVELWRAGSDLKAVGRVLGVSASTVNRYIRKAGVSAEEISTRRGLRCQA